MKIRIFLNSGNALKEITDQSGPKNSEGWWNSIIADDFDNDGEIDFVSRKSGIEFTDKGIAL